MKKNVKSVPEIRFPGFTDLWEERKLGNTVQITMGQSPNGGTYSDVPSDYILVQGNADLRNGWVFPRVWTSQMTKQADAGDLIMSVRAPAGAMGKTAYNVVIGRGVAAIKGNEFMYQLLVKMDSDGYWKTLSCGSTFESLNSNNIKNADVFIPDIAEQKKIGKYFFNLDNLITFQETQCKVLKDFKQCMLQKMFPKDGSDKPEIRFPGFTGSWEQRKLGEITVESPEYATLETGLPLLTSSRRGLMYQNEYRGNQTTDNKKTLFSVVPLGACTYRHMSDDDVFHLNINSLEKGLVSREYPVFTACDGNNLNFMVQYVNSSNQFRSFCKEQRKGGTRTRLYYSALGEFELMIPTPAEQHRIASYLNNLDHLIALQERKCKVLRKLKKCMLQKMFV